jgi:hypothetical protein
MTYDMKGPGGLDYFPCRYGKSKLLFRGPKRRLNAPYVAFFGSTETYGKFIKTPFPALIESRIGINCVNFGIPNAGVDAFVKDDSILDAGAHALVSVVQVMGAQNLSNRLYSVHPRRNDRFVAASDLLTTIYRDVDFSEFHFTRHMLSRLYAVSPERFAAVQSELRAAWVARMRSMLEKIPGKIVLLWFAPDTPPQTVGQDRDPMQGREPLLITRPMLEQIAPSVTEIVEAVAPDGSMGPDGMEFAPLDAPAAAEMMGPDAHANAAQMLAPILDRLSS